MPPRSYIRHRDLRIVTDDVSAKDIEKSEHDFARGRYFEADCLATDEVGDFVHISGPPVGGSFQVTQVDITNPAHMPTAGLITEKTSATRCFVVRFGVVDVSSFPGAPTLVPQGKYWIGFDGKLSSTVPVPVSGVAVVQLVGLALSDTELLIQEGSQPFKLRR